MNPPKRPSTKNQGTPVPPKYRFIQEAVMIFELTKEQRAKLVLGYNVKVSVSLRMEHKPGRISAAQRIDVTEQVGFQPGDRLEVLGADQAPKVVSEEPKS